MSETILITSGKGGVGKSTACTMLGAALAKQGYKVLMIETDCGLRNLDIMNGASDRAVYDLADVLLGECEPLKAIIGSSMHENLFLIPATNKVAYIPERSGLERLIQGLEEYYDYILADCPAGFSSTLYAVMSAAKRALVVTIPTLISAKDGAKAGDILFEAGIRDVRLIINMVPKKFVPSPSIPDLDAVIDLTGLQLIGMVPEDRQLNQSINNGVPCPVCPASKAFELIARRLEGSASHLDGKFQKR